MELKFYRPSDETEYNASILEVYGSHEFTTALRNNRERCFSN